MEVTVKKHGGKLVGEISLDDIDANEGDTLALIHVGGRVELVSIDVANQLEAAKKVMSRRRAVLRELAK